MEFLKKNYEKIILSVVLLGLAVAAVFLPVSVSGEKRRLVDIENLDVTTIKRELPPVDLSTNESVLRRLRRPEETRLSREHNLFNPVQWQKRSGGTLVKVVRGDEIGPGALEITDIKPLKLIVSYEGSRPLGNEIQHRFKVTREADRVSRNRTPVTLSVTSVGVKNTIFILKDMQPPENPSEFVLEMVDGKKQITVKAQEPHESVAGHMVDLKYPPEKQVFIGKRLDDRLSFAGDTNKIVAITATAVTVEALSNKKRTTIETTTSPDATSP